MADNFNTLDQATTTSAGITDGTIVNADINASAAIDESKIASLVTDLAAKTAKATLTTKGDLYVASAASTPARLGVAADNTALLAPDSAAAGGVSWSTGPTITGEFTARDFKVTGMTGAVNPGRFVGVTASGAPTTGTFAVGDYVVTQTGQMFICVIAGTPGTWVTPQPLSNALTTGQETFDRGQLTSTSVASTTQSLRLSYFTARKSENSTQVRVYSGNTAAAATPSICRIGLYTVAANGDITLVASTANDTTLFAATNTVYTKSWSVAYDMVAGQRYALGVLVVTAGAAPTYCGSVGGNAAEWNTAPMVAATVTGQSDLPSPVVAASQAASTNRIYGAILP